MGNNNGFGALQLSAVHELANIGLGHATTALSDLTGRRFNMSIPRVDSVPVSTLVELVGGAETVCVGVCMPIEGDIEGHIAFLFPWESAQRIWTMLIGTAPEDLGGVGELEASVMLEVGNILNSSFLNALADMTNLTLHATPPMVSVEMTCAIAESIVVQAEQRDVTALAVETAIFDQNDETTRGYFLCIPTVNGLRLLLNRLGVPEAA